MSWLKRWLPSVAVVGVIVVMVTANTVRARAQRVTDSLSPSPYWHGRPMLARWADRCAIVVVEDVESPDVVNVSWPDDEADGRSWCYGPIPPSRLEPLKR